MRDALGLVRLLWLLEREGIDIDRATMLTEAGVTLAKWLEMGRCRPDTIGYRAAVSRSAETVEQLAAVEWSAGVAVLVRAARERVCGGQARR